MGWLLRAHDRICLGLIRILLRLALAVDEHRVGAPRRWRRWRGSVRRVLRDWLRRHGLDSPPPFPRRRRPWNRTLAEVEEKVVRLHVEQPLLGAGQLRFLAARVLGFSAARETFRQILIRRRDLVVALDQERRRRPRRIHVSRARQLWGADLTLVWILGFIPAWVLGVVDYHGSRLVAFERLPWPTAADVARVLGNAARDSGPPDRLLTDRGPVFRALAVQLLLAEHGVRHVLIRPAHPWTGGRIERVFRTFKETVFGLVWLVASHRQLDRFTHDFLTWHNRDRPHASYAGLTPDEVYFGRPRKDRPLGRVSHFDGRLRWYRFG
jgi:transposase InsO family protein